MIKVLYFYYIILVNNSQGINNIPLIPAIGSKNLDDLPHRILRFSLSLARVDYLIIHVPGDNALHCPEHQDCQNDYLIIIWLLNKNITLKSFKIV